MLSNKPVGDAHRQDDREMGDAYRYNKRANMSLLGLNIALLGTNITLHGKRGLTVIHR